MDPKKHCKIFDKRKKDYTRIIKIFFYKTLFENIKCKSKKSYYSDELIESQDDSEKT